MFVLSHRIPELYIAALGSLSIALAYPVVSLVVGRPGREVAVSALVAGILVVRHRSNIGRIVRRDERRFGDGRISIVDVVGRGPGAFDGRHHGRGAVALVGVLGGVEEDRRLGLANGRAVGNTRS